MVKPSGQPMSLSVSTGVSRRTDEVVGGFVVAGTEVAGNVVLNELSELGGGVEDEAVVIVVTSDAWVAVTSCSDRRRNA